MTGLRSWILEQLEAERGRWMLWLPVAMGLGIAVYFELPVEPALWLGPAMAGAAAVAVALAPAGSKVRALCVGVVVAAWIIGVLENLAAVYIGFIGFDLKVAVPFVLIFVVLIVRPQGLFGRKVVVRV